jgi:hypothetical protein
MWFRKVAEESALVLPKKEDDTAPGGAQAGS